MQTRAPDSDHVVTSTTERADVPGAGASGSSERGAAAPARAASAGSPAAAMLGAAHVGSTVAGRYFVERLLGEGTMGIVVAARHVSLDEVVAMKFLKPELRRDASAVARFALEAKALARIKSDHVVRVLDVGATLSIGPYLVMEYLDGTDLGQVLLTSGPLTVPRAIEYVLRACEALAVAHAAGVIHRDLEPENLFLARHGPFETLKVLDFGVAQALAPAAPSSLPDPLLGTPTYMAPERIRRDPAADHRSDIWSLGVVLHELVTGHAVFEGASAAETCERILSGAAVLEQNDVLLPPPLRAVIARCLEPEPARRFASVDELAAALVPLATMHERFRGRLTNSFPRPSLPPGGVVPARERPKTLAAQLGERASRLLQVPAVARLRGHAVPGVVNVPRAVVLLAGTLLVTGAAVAQLGGVSLVQPRPASASVAASAVAPRVVPLLEPRAAPAQATFVQPEPEGAGVLREQHAEAAAPASGATRAKARKRSGRRAKAARRAPPESALAPALERPRLVPDDSSVPLVTEPEAPEPRRRARLERPASRERSRALPRRSRTRAR